MSKKFRLLTTAIVAALHPNEPQAVGTVWEADERAHELEGEALVAAGYAAIAGKGEAATKTDDADDTRTPEEIERDEAIGKFIGRPADEVIADLKKISENADSLTDEQRATLPHMLTAEQNGKKRKTVLEALEAVITPKLPE